MKKSKRKDRVVPNEKIGNIEDSREVTNEKIEKRRHQNTLDHEYQKDGVDTYNDCTVTKKMIKSNRKDRVVPNDNIGNIEDSREVTNEKIENRKHQDTLDHEYHKDGVDTCNDYTVIKKMKKSKRKDGVDVANEKIGNIEDSHEKTDLINLCRRSEKKGSCKITCVATNAAIANKVGKEDKRTSSNGNTCKSGSSALPDIIRTPDVTAELVCETSEKIKKKISNDVTIIDDTETSVPIPSGGNAIGVDGFSPLHLITSITYNADKIEALRKQGIVKRRGKWTPEEVEKLNENMKEFLASHDVKDFVGLILVRSKEDRIFRKKTNFILNMCKGIQRRAIDVIKKVLSQFSHFLIKGRYSVQEKEELIRLHKIYGNNWKQIGLLTNRNHHDLFDVYNSASKKWNRGIWTKEEEKALLTSATDFIKRDIPISWRTVSENVGSRSKDSCYKKWHSTFVPLKDRHNNLRWVTRYLDDDDNDDHTAFSNEYVYELITFISDANVDDEYLVDWNDMSKKFDHKFAPNWLKWKFGALCKEVPHSHMLEFLDLVDQLYEIYRQKVDDNC